MRIMLAAIESSAAHSEAVFRANAPSVLTSYYYAKDAPSPNVLNAVLKKASMRFIDSGAFTIRTAALNKGNGETEKATLNFETYLNEYIEWLRAAKTAGLADYWVEVDVGVVTGYEWVEEQRKAYEKAGIASGLVNVWHSDKDWAYWLYLLDEACRPGRSRYVAIEGHARGRGALDYVRFLKAAYDKGVRVHGFKMTAASDLHRYPFFSVDSSSWTSPTTYGANFVHRIDGTLAAVGKESLHKTESYVLKSGRPPRRPSQAQCADIDTGSALAWIEMARQVTRMWKMRGVDWNKALRVHTNEGVFDE